MAEAKRDRSIVSIGWLAWWALQGDEDRQFVAEYVDHAREVLAVLMGSADRPADKEFQREMVELANFLFYLAETFKAEGDTAVRIEFTTRQGRGGDSRHERALRGNNAAAIFDAAIERGLPRKRALGEAEATSGLSRSQIEKWLSHRRLVQEWARDVERESLERAH